MSYPLLYHHHHLHHHLHHLVHYSSSQLGLGSRLGCCTYCHSGFIWNQSWVTVIDYHGAYYMAAVGNQSSHSGVGQGLHMPLHISVWKWYTWIVYYNNFTCLYNSMYEQCDIYYTTSWQFKSAGSGVQVRFSTHLLVLPPYEVLHTGIH